MLVTNKVNCKVYNKNLGNRLCLVFVQNVKIMNGITQDKIGDVKYDKLDITQINVEEIADYVIQWNDKCLIIFSKNIHDYLLNTYECNEIATLTACNGNTTIYKMNYKGTKVALTITQNHQSTF